MSEDTLAQEEIDALLSAAAGDTTPEPEPIEDPSLEIADEFLNSAREIFLSLLGNDVDIAKGESGPIPVDMFAQELSASVAVAFVTPSKGLTAKGVIIFDEKKASIVTDLILMGEGEEKESFSEDDIDALKEAINQTMGNLGQNLTGKYSEPIAFDQAEIKIFSPEEALAAVKERIPDESYHSSLFTLKIADKVDTPFRLLLPLSIEDEVTALKAKAVAPPPEAAEPSPVPTVTSEASEVIDGNLDIILDLEVEILVRLGEAVRPLKDIRHLVKGKILKLDRAADAPVEILVNNTVIARGELVVIPPHYFAINITEVKNRLERIKNLQFDQKVVN